ncbi:MAG: transcription repressor NadR [Bacillota bacterium]|nr:transcription repressor NadR [Bacillota bacterium]MDD3299004.1 transcription repressor NadR [Bacillota bacterium]MDD3851771.1 transcription repressor NadR [Bacillota bacterium]MDD4708325.1 transcription repressor NadR [Bacillota bacterium]
MVSAKRRKNIIRILRTATGPIKGMDLADSLGVTRQVIVQDIAILRAAGEDIIATPRGYLLTNSLQPKAVTKTIACRHHTNEEMEQELTAIVDLGGSIIDVIIEHPVYGEKRGVLMITSRQDVKDFMNSIEDEYAQPLSSLTGGVHIHTIQVRDEESYIRIWEELKRRGFLIEE